MFLSCYFCFKQQQSVKLINSIGVACDVMTSTMTSFLSTIKIKVL